MQGLADGSGVPYKQILQVHMLPELIKAHCSIIGAWGPAISGTSGSLYQLRALDWSTNGPFQAFPALTVYHPEEGNGHDFAILGWSKPSPQSFPHTLSFCLQRPRSHSQ